MKLFYKYEKSNCQLIKGGQGLWRIRRIMYSSLFVMLSFCVKAQVFPPDLQCVVNDTLVWQLPNNNCGTFTSYEIFFSANENGPYQSLTIITNQNQTKFYHNNPTGETWYYYMVSNYNCPGDPVLSSDTLNNLSPEIPPITSVSVNGGDVEIIWQSSVSPEVSYYIIYRTTSQGTIPIDTVSSLFNSYVDVGGLPDEKSESYYVIATDECGNTSVFDLPHLTIHVEESIDVCERTIRLNWNLYENWSNGIKSQELWLSLNGGTPTMIESLFSTRKSYLFKNTNDGDAYCFFIKAIEKNTSEVSFSNERCFVLDVVEPVRELIIKNVSVNAANKVELTWHWNNDAEIQGVKIHGNYINEIEVIKEIFVPAFPLSIENTRVLDSYDPSRDKLYFKMESFDDCDDAFLSNKGSTIFLSGTPEDNLTNKISWTEFAINGGTVLNYDIFRIVDGVETFVKAVNAGTTNFTDEIDASNQSEENVCYYVVANVNIQLPGGFEEQIISRSNSICIEQFSKIIAPNAFAPNGINQEFKPVIIFGNTAEYLMVIYDRWGRKVFETQSQDEGWTGKNGLNLHPAGVYAYYIQIKQLSGNIVKDKGTVILLQ